MNIQDTLQEGTILNGRVYSYKIEKILGQGSFGVTYLASADIEVSGPLGKINSTIQVAIKEFFMKELNGRDGSTVTCSTKGGGTPGYAPVEQANYQDGKGFPANM